MNYLGHAYLSFNNPPILVGNMISDFVKGKAQYNFPPAIQFGIKLHRQIDEFTDKHPSTKEIKKYFVNDYRLYAGAFVDIVYDYYLANYTDLFKNEVALMNFSKNVYEVLEQNKTVLPTKFLNMLPYMMQQNWLFNYQYTWGIQKSFMGLVKRSAYLIESEKAFNIFVENIEPFKAHSNVFIKDVIFFTKNKLEEILNLQNKI